MAASCAGILNNQFARVSIGYKEGYCDIYNTRKRSVSEPHLYGFRDAALQAQVGDLWREFYAGDKTVPPKPRGPLAEATYYYQILKPYADCEFDFHALALALNLVARRMGRQGVDAEADRYDFGKLEATYTDLEGGT